MLRWFHFWTNWNIKLFADAAGGALLRFGCYFHGQWCQGMWSKTDLFDNGCKPNIALLELLAIIMAVELWAPLLTRKVITLRSSNMSTVVFINKMKADIPTTIILLCHVTLTCLQFQIHLQAVHIEGIKNLKSDLMDAWKGEQRAAETSEVAVAPDLIQGMLHLGEPVSSFLLQHPIESHPLNLSASGLLFCQIISKEREAGENDVVMEKELNKSFQEPPVGEIHTPPSKLCQILRMPSITQWIVKSLI